MNETRRVVTFSQDLESKTYKVKFRGSWARGDLDRLHKLLLKELKHYKLALRKADEGEKAKAKKEGNDG